MVIKLNYILLTLCFGLINPFSLLAQDVCATPSSYKACVGEEIFFTKCGQALTGKIIYDFGDGRGAIENELVTSVIYLIPGTYTVTQYRSGDNIISVRGPVATIQVLPLIKPSFYVETCENREVKVHITDNNYESYQIDFENDGIYDANNIPGAGSVTPHTYPDETNYTIKVRPSAPPGCYKTDSLVSIRTYAALEKPAISSLLTLSDNQIQLFFNDLKSYLSYRVEMSIDGGTFIEVAKIKDINQPLVLEGLNTLSKSYCFKVVAYDGCNNIDPSDETVCNLRLTGSVQNNLNLLEWTSDQIFNEFYVYKESVLVSNNGLKLDYDDNQVKCNQIYAYTIVGKSGTSTTSSNSLSLKATSNDIPPTITNLTPSIDIGNETLNVTWTNPGGTSVQQYTLERLSGANFPGVIYSGTNSSIVDANANKDSVNCFSISYTDSCNNISEKSLKACSIVLKGRLLAKDDIKLEWTPFEGWENGVKEYIIQKFDGSSNPIETISNTLTYEDLTVNNVQVVRYRIKAISNENPNLYSYSNLIEIKQNFIIALPNAIIPDGDVINSTFSVKGRYIKNVRFFIYNKWGELIYEGSNWDGKLKGKTVPSDIYLYKLEAEDETGEKIKQKGNITIIN